MKKFTCTTLLFRKQIILAMAFLLIGISSCNTGDSRVIP